MNNNNIQSSYMQAILLGGVYNNKDNATGCNRKTGFQFEGQNKERLHLKMPQNNIRPMGIDRLKQRNPQLYKIIAKVCDNKYV